MSNKALVPLGLIAAAGVMGSLASGQANRHAFQRDDRVISTHPSAPPRYMGRVLGPGPGALVRVSWDMDDPFVERLVNVKYLKHADAGRRAALPGRKFKTVGSTTIRFDRDYDEYIVIPQGAESAPDSWYYTDDREDAMATAKFIEAKAGQRVAPRRSTRRRRRSRRV
jgi:hypothetical protein